MFVPLDSFLFIPSFPNYFCSHCGDVSVGDFILSLLFPNHGSFTSWLTFISALVIFPYQNMVGNKQLFLKSKKRERGKSMYYSMIGVSELLFFF